MSNLYNAVRDLSGQRNTISIQRPYVRMLGGDYNLAVVLSQLVFLSGLTSRDDGWFYKKYDETKYRSAQIKCGMPSIS